jgi:hypothetical protein
MPLLEPGAASGSYLIYKLVTNAENFGPPERACRSAYDVAFAPGDCVPASRDELGRLRDWFVALDPMPPQPEAVDPDVLERIVRFATDGDDCDR